MKTINLCRFRMKYDEKSIKANKLTWKEQKKVIIIHLMSHRFGWIKSAKSTFLDFIGQEHKVS